MPRAVQVYMDTNDLNQVAEIHEMIDSGHSVTAQMIPNESDQSILNYLQ